MKWTDTREIVDALIDAHPEADPSRVNFLDLMNWVVVLPGFSDDPKHCGERILEAIQATWIEEAD